MGGLNEGRDGWRVLTEERISVGGVSERWLGGLARRRCPDSLLPSDAPRIQSDLFVLA